MRGFSVIDFCFHTQGKAGTMFLQDHLILFVLKGVYTVRHGNQVYTVNSNEMVFLQKSIAIEFEKSGELESGHVMDCLMFFFKEEVITDFIKFADLDQPYSVAFSPILVKPVTQQILGYIDSLKTFFIEPERISEGLVKIKLMELLFHISAESNYEILSLLQPKKKEEISIHNVINENLTNPVSLNDLAYLSGRSLSTFKREFESIYNTSPLRWIRNRRLDKAKELLTNTTMSITDVCFSCGFENTSHFSKIFKERFGYPPSKLKLETKNNINQNKLHAFK